MVGQLARGSEVGFVGAVLDLVVQQVDKEDKQERVDKGEEHQ
jgi:hypothetical protein